MIEPISITILSIIILFIILLVLKRLLSIKFCVICTSVSLTWMLLLVLYWLGKFPYPVLIAVLMGQSVVGVYYLLEKKLAEKYYVFRLPFLLTATVIVYLLLKIANLQEMFLAVSILFVLWLLTGLLYLYRHNRRVGKIFKQVIACCRDW